MTVDIRILSPDDEALLARASTQVFDNPIVVERAIEFLRDSRHHIAAAIEKDTIVGFASAVHYVHPDKANPEFWINEVGVADSHQSQGIGKALMQAILKVAQELGCSEAWVLTERENLPALRLYKSITGEVSPEDTVMFTFYLKRDK